MSRLMSKNPQKALEVGRASAELPQGDILAICTTSRTFPTMAGVKEGS